MPVELASEIWSEIKRYISPVDKDEAAETIVNIMIDNDIDVEDIKSSFKGDTEIKRALSQYTRDSEVEEIEEDYDDSMDEDDQY